MKTFFSILILLVWSSIFAQSPKESYPNKINTLYYNFTDELLFYQSIENCDSIQKAISSDEVYASLSDAQLKQLEACDKESYNYYDVSVLGCSWYCGGGPDSVYASSILKSNKNYTYDIINIGDGDHSTAWVEGSKGNGIGEWIEFKFGFFSPRITTISIANGYVKSDKSFIENSRVKKIKVYYEGKVWGFLNLEDGRSEQYFNLDTLGHTYDKKPNANTPEHWTLRLEIIEIYPGSKYSDLAISEIGFDGIDVHCLAASTKIMMADSSTKNIENLKIGDFILSFNEKTQSFEEDEILGLANAWHNSLYQIKFVDGTQLIITDDHPIYNIGKWESLNPEKSNRNYSYSTVYPLNTQFIQGKKIISINKLEEWQKTYTIVKLRKNSSFSANGIIVGTETLK